MPPVIDSVKLGRDCSGDNDPIAISLNSPCVG